MRVRLRACGQSRRFRSADAVDTIKQVWAQTLSLPTNAPSTVPNPVQPDGLPVYSSSVGPKSLRQTAKWADGLAAGFDTVPNLKTVQNVFAGFHLAWELAGRKSSRSCGPLSASALSAALPPGSRISPVAIWRLWGLIYALRKLVRWLREADSCSASPALPLVWC